MTWNEHIELLKKNRYVAFIELTEISQKILRHVGKKNLEVKHLDNNWNYAILSTPFSETSVYRIKADYMPVLIPKWFQLCCEKQPKPRSEEPIEEILFHGPATVVFWEDGTKTVSTLAEGDKFDPVFGYLLNYFKKHSGMSKTKIAQFFDYLRSVYVEDGRYED